MTKTNHNHSSIKDDERHWQDRQGGALQVQAYQRPGTQIVFHQQFARVLDALQLGRGMRLLDVGCGTGLFLEWLSQRVQAESHGIDLSPNSIEMAKRTNPKLLLTAGDAEALPYQDDSFQRISCNGAGHHLLDFLSALREMYRVLAPGGIVVFYEPTATPFSNAVRGLFLQDDKFESPADLAHKDEFTGESVKRLLAEVGFINITTSSHDFIAYPLSGMYLNLPLGRSRTAMKFLTQLESKLDRLRVLKSIFNLFTWRFLVVATKPMTVA